MPATPIPSLDLAISDLARNSEILMSQGLNNPGPLTIALIFSAGLLTSLGPCSLSLMPVTVAFLAGFNDRSSPFVRSTAFCSGIVLALVLLGSVSGLLGNIYGQVPSIIPTLVAILAVLMGLNLLGLMPLPLPSGPDPRIWQKKVPKPLAPVAAGLAFGLAASPCTTPVLAVLLGWIAQSGSPLTGVLFLAIFGIGQILPLLIAGTAAATIPSLLAMRPLSRWIPSLSGVILLVVGVLSLLSNWT